MKLRQVFENYSADKLSKLKIGKKTKAQAQRGVKHRRKNSKSEQF